MKDQILAHLNEPAELEKLYRSNKAFFKKEFTVMYQQLKGSSVAEFWNERLNDEADEISLGGSGELVVVIIACLVAGLIAKLPSVLPLSEDFFYPRNVGFIFFPALMAYFGWKNKIRTGSILFITIAVLLGAVFINLFPDVKTSDTLILSCVHLILFLWAILGFVFVAGKQSDLDRRLSYLKYNGDLVVMTTLILLSGALMSGLTVGLFKVIGFKIDDIYFQYVGIFGLSFAPIIGTFLTQTNPQLVGRVSPVIARIFSPLVLVMLVIYLGAMVFSGRDPYNDREFLLIFNALLIGVMAIIFFSVAGTPKAEKSKPEVWLLLLLSALTIVVNGIALSAILFRIAEWGITPNRAAVLGSNVLILINLFLVTVQLFRVVSNKADLAGVGRVVALYLPIYFVWTIIVTFIFPLIFDFK